MGVLALFLVGSPVLAAEVPALAGEREALIERVLTLAGANTQLAQVPTQLAAQLEARRAEFTPEAFGRVTTWLAEAFKPDALHASLAQSFEQAYDRETLEQVAAWLSRPLTQRLTGLEQAAMRPDAAAAQEAFFSQPGVAARPGEEDDGRAGEPSEARVVLLQRLLRATHATDTTLRVIRAVMAGIANAVNASLDRPPASPDELREAAIDLEASRGQIEDRILARLLFTYRDVSDADLGAYVAFWESDAGQWFARVSSDAYLHAIEQGAASLDAVRDAVLSGAERTARMATGMRL